ncbi:Protoporphyrinogen oxidase [Trametopsis cervina]|nr:Protoporphyrinogen oxidase [Trametopsis cervina]
MPPPTHISILGGGLTGLSSAYHLSKRFPGAAITLLEKSPRAGGWVSSERVEVKDSHGNIARILMERGPRTLRPNGKSTLELINLLGLQSSLITVPKSAPAARTRFLHIPGTNGLTALPSSVTSALASPLGRRLAKAIAFEPFKRYGKGVKLEDDSLEHFLAARIGPDLARLLGSALVHGIYAADARQLSVKAAFPSLWEATLRGKGSIVRGMLTRSDRSGPASADDYELGDIPKLLEDVSVYSFHDGMSTLTATLEYAVRRRPNVEIVINDSAATLQNNTAEGNIIIHSEGGREISSSHIVSAIPLPVLGSLLQRSSQPLLPNLTANPSSSVNVVNVVFPPTSVPIHPEGFGYLVPRAEDGHVEVLGTVFDSCSLSAQDEYTSPDAPRFTKLTMMIRSESSLPPVTVERVLQHLTNHLQPQTPIPEPALFQVHAMRDCIPVPTVGHVKRTQELQSAAESLWRGRLKVVGAGVGGVSVADCIEQGRQVGREWT